MVSHNHTAPVLSVLAALAIGIAGCGSSPTSAKPVNLAFVYTTKSQNFAMEMAYGAKAAASGLSGVNLIESAPAESNSSLQVQMFTSAELVSKDGIGLQTVTPTLLERSMSDAVAAGIPIVAVDGQPTPGSHVSLFVGNSNLELGEALGNEIAARIPASQSGEVVIGNPIPGLPVLDQRVNGIKKAVAAKRPDITVQGQFDSKLKPDDNLKAWRDLVQSHPGALAYLGPGDQDAVSLAQIKSESRGRFLVGACALEPAALEGVKKGLVDVIVSPEHWLKGYIAIRLLADHAQHGTPLPAGWWNPGHLVITAANVDPIIARQRDESSRTAAFQAVIKEQFANPSQFIRPLSEAS